jgi:hypothetical protein
MRTPYHLSPLGFTGSFLLAAVLVILASLPVLNLGAAVVA